MMHDDKRQQRILDNKGLIYNILRKYDVNQQTRDYDDYVSIGMIGLIKAVDTFKENEGTKFSTYASKCIENELIQNYKENKKYDNDISLQQPIVEDEDETLEDIIEDISNVEKTEELEMYVDVINIALNYLSEREIMVLFYRIGGINNKGIAQRINMDRQTVPMIAERVSLKIGKGISDFLEYEELFSIDKVEHTCNITFILEKCEDINKIIRFLKDFKSNGKIIDFSINESYFTVKFHFDSVYFNYIADIMKMIYDLGQKYAPKKSKIAILPKKENSGKKRITKVEQVKQYILDKDSFIVKDIVKNFSNVSQPVIFNAIKQAKEEGLVFPTSKKGEYVVKKSEMPKRKEDNN